MAGWCACSSSGAGAPPGGAAGGDGSTGSAPPADGGDTDTWANYAQAAFAKYCVSCHDAKDTTGRDFTMQAIVERDKLVIRCGVAAAQDPAWGCAASPTARQFPIGNGPKPTDAERARVVAWITAGAP